MKKLILMCAVILSLGVMVGCSKDDDGPSSGGKVSGSFSVDGKKADLKYGYVYYDDDEIEYTFYDKNLMNYMGDEEPNVEFSALYISYDTNYSEVDFVGMVYKMNPSKDTGNNYCYETDDDVKYLISYSASNGKIESSSKGLPMYGYTVKDEWLGNDFEGSYSISGKVTDMSDFYEYDEYTRSVEVTEVTDPKQIAFLKSLKKKSFNTLKEK